MLCPYPGGAGGAGVGGGGTGGRGGSGGGGRGGGTGGHGGGGPAGGLIVSAPLALDRAEVSAGQTLAGEVTYENTSNTTIIVTEIRIAARAPDATHSGGPYTDLAPVLKNVVLQVHDTVTLEASRTFTGADTLGTWEAYATHQDSTGWHDAPSVHFEVVASSGAAGSGGGPTPTGFSVGTQEWFIASWSGANIWRSGINWSTAYSSGADVWRPEFLADLAGFSVFRHMDTNAVNWSDISRWSQRKLPTDPRNAEVYIDGSSPSDTTGMAVEWQVDLCNRAAIDCWFTHPYLSDDDYIRQQATLIRSKLNANLRVYIELSNEVWNGGFSAYDQAIAAGKAGGLPGSNDYYVGIAHEMFRALQMYELYAEVFGTEAMGSRVIRVFSESGNLDLTTQALRNVYVSSHWNPHGQHIDMIALAPYIGNGVSGANETLARWKSEVDSKVNGEPIKIALDSHIKPYGIPLLGCYEAGMHHLSSADVWARNPDAYDAYQYMLERFGSKMNAVCALYTLHGNWQSSGAWGLFANVGQSISQAPKARGTKDWIVIATGRGVSHAPWIAWLVALIIIAIGIAFCLHRIRVHRAAFEARMAARIAESEARPTPTPDDPPTGGEPEGKS